MTANHHPSDQTLLRYAAGNLPAGPALVVAAHLSGCPACQRKVAGFEVIGGQLLAQIEPERLSPGALGRALEKLELDERKTTALAGRPSHMSVDGILLPDVLSDCGVGPWRTVGPGVKLSRITIPHAPEANVILLKVKANKHMPAHGHSDLEVTQVLTGSFSDGGNRYVAGDFVEGDDETDHSPIIGSERECISLAAIEGRIHFRGFIGKLLQPFVGI